MSDHHVISATGERKSTGFMPGLDLQSGTSDGGAGCPACAVISAATSCSGVVRTVVALGYMVYPALAAAEELAKEGVSVEVIRAVDHEIATGVWPDMTEHGWATDAWPAIHERVMASDILVLAGPIWLGDNSSVTTCKSSPNFAGFR